MNDVCLKNGIITDLKIGHSQHKRNHKKMNRDQMICAKETYKLDYLYLF